jgi:polar amino acid transport system ATP-binding protein
MVEMQGVHKWYGHTHVLRGIDLTVPKGSVCTVLGPSGSGKSTMLRCINQLEEIGAGRIYVDGVLAGYRDGERGGRPTLFRLHPKEIARQRANVGMVFQRFNLFPHMTALGNVTEAQVQVLRRTKEQAHQRAVDMLERVGLGAFRDRYPHTLSGGQRKRVGLAQVLIRDPKILMMDEPFGPLDAQTRQIMGNLLLSLWAADRKACLFVTHDLEEAIALADRVFVLSARPATLKKVYEIDLPRPRVTSEIRYAPQFVELSRQIWHDLREEVQIA